MGEGRRRESERGERDVGTDCRTHMQTTEGNRKFLIMRGEQKWLLRHDKEIEDGEVRFTKRPLVIL